MHLKSGIYEFRFRTPTYAGWGFLYCAGGELRGGDARCFYEGTYSENADFVHIRFTIGIHTAAAGDTLTDVASALGLSNAELHFSGREDCGIVKLDGYSPQVPDLHFDATLSPLVGQTKDSCSDTKTIAESHHPSFGSAPRKLVALGLPQSLTKLLGQLLVALVHSFDTAAVQVRRAAAARGEVAREIILKASREKCVRFRSPEGMARGAQDCYTSEL